ncbi:MAG: hypothetical protein JMN25_01855 [gamma proteobacterium endosymbiont of Lamellibrachia anaximandri]|nr:hypothetical protein [gamma proteobacterium endosymbiont of Lamellibrachia anaximandri]
MSDYNQGKTLAIISEGLYLLNLLFPLLPLLGLAWLRYRHRSSEFDLVRNHLPQAFIGACISSSIFVAANLLILALGGYGSIAALITFEVYFIAVVPLFLIPGLMALIKAMSGQQCRYPLIGSKYAR